MKFTFLIIFVNSLFASALVGNFTIGDLTVDGDAKILTINQQSIQLGVYTGDFVRCENNAVAIACLTESNATFEVVKVEPTTTNYTTYRIIWNTKTQYRLQDRVLFGDAHWYGGCEMWEQSYPFERQIHKLDPYITGDIFKGEYGPKMEKYWLSSNKIAITSPFDSTLWIAINEVKGALSLHSQVLFSTFDNFKSNRPVELVYDLHVVNNQRTSLRDFHISLIKTKLGIPKSIPDKRMLTQPFWSTWAQFKFFVNNDNVIQLSEDIIKHGFTNNSHIEIDDKWQSFYGDMTYKKSLSTSTIKALHNVGFDRVTLWSHPFINRISRSAVDLTIKNETRLLVQDGTNKCPANVHWWDGRLFAWIVDMTSKDGSEYFLSRHMAALKTLDIESYKFDAGGAIWLGRHYTLSNATHPNHYPQAYAKTISKVNSMIEMRVACNTQNAGRFVRLMDKDSDFTMQNGLSSMVSAMITMSINGYSFLLPDMIGGNAYIKFPSDIVYVRWVQANVFMPAMQFSLAPWDKRFKSSTIDVLAITQEMYLLRESYADYIWHTAQQSLEGIPMIRPLWFLEETADALTNSDSYMFGDKILVAPMLDETNKRNIYLPKGKWAYQGNDSRIYEGPNMIRLTVPFEELPYFHKIE